jgi:hypothetical protein
VLGVGGRFPPRRLLGLAAALEGDLVGSMRTCCDGSVGGAAHLYRWDEKNVAVGGGDLISQSAAQVRRGQLRKRSNSAGRCLVEWSSR